MSELPQERSNHLHSKQKEYTGPRAECRKPETAHGDTEHRPTAVMSEPIIPNTKAGGNFNAQPDTPQAEGDQEETPLMHFLSQSQGDLEETLPKQSYSEPKKKILPLLDARTEQPKPNYDENETPLKTVQQPSNTVQQPPDTVLQPSDTVQQPPDTVLQPSNTVQQPPDTVLQPSNTVQQPFNTVQQPQEPLNSVKQPLSGEQTLSLVKIPQAVHTPQCVAEDEANETPLKCPVNDDHVHNPDMRQQRRAGQQLSEERRNPTEPETLHYQERVLRELDSLPAAKPQEQRHLMSITDSLMPEEWEPAATKLDKFEVTFVLDKLLWVKQYVLDEDRINVYVDFDHFRNLTYIIVIDILKKLTLWDEIDFRVREMLPSDFTLFGSSQMVLSPGAEISVNNSNGRHAAIGTYLHCPENGKYYAITAGHLFSEGDACYRLGQHIGKCVFSWNSYTPPRTIDLALIELSTTAGKLELQNYIHSASAVECLLKLPETEEEVCAMECWKVQRKSRDNWQYGFLRYAMLTNKDHGLYRVVGIMRTVPQNPVVTEGDCGCLVTSLPRPGGELIVYGMFVGRLTQEADDGAEEPVEWYVAFPLKQALEMVISNGMFRGKTLDIVSRTDSGTGIGFKSDNTPQRAAEDDHVHNPDIRQQRQPGRQLSEERRSPTEPESLHYQEEMLRALDSLSSGERKPAQQNFLSITDSLMPEEWEPPTRRLDKFEVTLVLDKLPWVKQYMLRDDDDDRINVYVNYESSHNHKLAKMLVAYAFTLASLSDCGGSETMSKDKALEVGDTNVNEALEILREMKDNGKVAEALMTKAVLCRYSKSQQLKLYKEAEELCLQTFGQYHPLMARINLNTGICFEDSGDYQTSYDYFKKNLVVALEVYGKDHTRTKRSLGIMSEPMYARIAKQRGDVMSLD